MKRKHQRVACAALISELRSISYGNFINKNNQNRNILKLNVTSSRWHRWNQKKKCRKIIYISTLNSTVWSTQDSIVLTCWHPSFNKLDWICTSEFTFPESWEERLTFLKRELKTLKNEMQTTFQLSKLKILIF